MLNDRERINSLNEVRILASLNDKYIIGYKQAFLDEKSETLCLVMENAAKGDL